MTDGKELQTSILSVSVRRIGNFFGCAVYAFDSLWEWCLKQLVGNVGICEGCINATCDGNGNHGSLQGTLSNLF